MKRYLKKLGALLLTVAMVLSFCVCVSADGSYTIPVYANSTDAASKTDINDSSISYNHLLIIEADPTTETGWKLVSSVKDCFTSVFGDISEQAIIWKMIAAANKDANGNFTVTGIPTGTVAATDTEIQNVMKNISNLSLKLDSGREVTVPGMYYLKLNKEKWSYNPMAAYVSFKTYDAASGVPSQLESDGSVVKGKEITTEKKSSDSNGKTEIGRTVTYTVTSVIPYVPKYDANGAAIDRYYVIKDSISGAEYVKNTAGAVDLTIKVGAAPGANQADTRTSITGKTGTISSGDNGSSSFTVVLDDLLGSDAISSEISLNQYAGQPIEITYQAKVTGVVANNTVEIGDGKNTYNSEYGTDNVDSHTGMITFTKTGVTPEATADNPSPTPTLLSNAKFVVKKLVDTDTYKYAECKKDLTSGEYTFTGNWLDTDNEMDASATVDGTRLVTDSNGKVIIHGLDPDGITYFFEEVEAPSGYSINETPEDVSISATLETGDNEYKGSGSMNDTKISALPSTGGYGIYIFTIVGVVVMAVMASMFFIKRRRDAMND